MWEDDDEGSNHYDDGDDADALDEAGEPCWWECSVSFSGTTPCPKKSICCTSVTYEFYVVDAFMVCFYVFFIWCVLYNSVC